MDESRLTPLSRGLTSVERRASSASPQCCQICGSQDLRPGLDLGHQPVGDFILTREELDEPETYYPLQMAHCRDCGLAQLSYTVPPEVIYRDFPFLSGTTRTAREHLQRFAADMTGRLGLGREHTAVDIGSNDGTLLAGFRPCGVRMLGIDPAAEPVRLAREQGIRTLHAFFNDETAALIREDMGAAHAITAAGVFGHIADLTGLMRGVKSLLSPGGIFATDNQYFLDMVEQNHYDNIFHEHLRHYSIKPLQRLFAQYDMEILDVEHWPVYGGSIRVFCGHRGEHDASPGVAELLEREESAGLYTEAVIDRFIHAVENKRRRLFERVYEIRSRGARVIGIGAPAKASTVCNYCRLDPSMVDYLTEVNPLRIGKYLPGVHLPIVDESRMFVSEYKRAAGILFAWNYYDEIVPKLRARGYEGEILTP